VSELLAACVLVALALYCGGAFLFLRRLRKPSTLSQSSYFPPLTLIKPIHGTEEQLESNLRSFFEQDYPADFEMIFSSTEENDPGICLAKQLSLAYPRISCQFILSNSGAAKNPKVANMLGALAVARNDMVFHTDANVRVQSNYLKSAVREYLDTDAGLLSSYFLGVGEQSCGAAMENLQLTTFNSPIMCLAETVAGVPCVTGKSALFRRSELQSLGGLESLKDMLAEDYLLGRLYQTHGRPVVLSTEALIYNVNCLTTLRMFLARHSRWLKINAVLHPAGFLVRAITNPVFWAALLILCSTSKRNWLIFAGLAIAGKVLLDYFFLSRIRGESMKLRFLLLSPLKDLLMALVSIHAIFSRQIVWRGKKLKLGAGTRLKCIS
jgi:ceramide glucosyltransferase